MIVGSISISEIISESDVTFNIGIGMGFVLGVAIGIIVYSLYRDIKKMRV
jgi:hypothetical protein